MGRKCDSGRKPKLDHCFILKFIYDELERGSNRALRWTRSGRAFEVCGRFVIPSESRLYTMKINKVEKILLGYGFRKKEGVERHIYLNRHFRRGESMLLGKLRQPMHGFCEYKDEFMYKSRWECGEVDLKEWYGEICEVYESTKEMLQTQREIIETLKQEITRLVGVGIAELNSSPGRADEPQRTDASG